MVLVALFRYDVYQRRFLEALTISQQARDVIRPSLEWPHDGRTLSEAHLVSGGEKSMVKVRFYWLCLKGEAYLYARLGQPEEATALLEKMAEIDAHDHLGAAALLAVVSARQSTRAPAP